MKKLVCLLLLLLNVGISSFAQRTQDSLALVSIYNSTGGANWTNKTNWLSSEPISKWLGVGVANGRVVQLSLVENNLVGIMPSDIGNLTMLTTLYLDYNKLSGTIPTEIGNLTNLSVLNLSGNKLSGSIPLGVWNMTNLFALSFGQNQLIGTIPSQIGNLINLRYFDLLNNQMTGNIPSEIWNLNKLEYLSLGFNNFRGSIPKEIGNLTKLTYLNLSQDNLIGNLPQEIWNLNKLTYLSLAQNYNLNGIIPSQIGNLQNLENLSLRYNQFTGDIPIEINNLTKLKLLSIDYNRFNQLPVLTVDSLNQLEIGQNHFTFGDIEPNITVSKSFYYVPQDSIGINKDTTVNINSAFTFSITCGGAHNQYQWYKDNNIIPTATSSTYTIPSLQQSDGGSYTCAVSNTVVTGLTIYSRPINIKVVDPSPLRQQDSLALVAIYNSTGGASWTTKTNWMSSQPISTWYGVTVNNNRVTRLALSGNNLQGTIPSEIGDLTELGSLYLQGCQLSGTIPAQIGNLSNLRYLNLNENHFTGSIPDEIGNLKNLIYIGIGNSNLSGTLPQGIWNLSKLLQLDLHNNSITGTIPPGIGNLKSLTGGLDLSYNKFYGQIPIEIGELTNLKCCLWLAANQFEGTFPNEINNLTQLQALNISNNGFDAFPKLTIDSLQRLLINGNRLTFNDIEPNINVSKRSFSYSPQDSIGIKQNIKSRTGKTYTVTVICGGAHSVYKWYKNGILIPSATNDTYKISKLKQSDAGSYTCAVTNTIVTGLTINSRPINLSVSMNGRALDSLALVTLYNSTGGSNWTKNTNWLSAQPISTWYGVTVGNNSGGKGGLDDTTSVIKLELSGNNLSGTIPKEIGNMNALQTLNLENNHLSGTVPGEINNLSFLQTLELSNNILNDLPTLTISSLNTLYINNNEFSFEDIVPNLNVPKNGFNYLVQDSIGARKDTLCRVGKGIKFIAIDSANHNIYQWYKDGTTIPTATNNSYQLSNLQEPDSGSYTCKIINTLVPALTIYQRPIKLHINIRTGINDININVIKVYPNPSSGIVYIEMDKSLSPKSKIVVTDIYGKTVLIKDLEDAKRQELDLSQLSKGMYFLQIQNKNNRHFQKIVIR